MRQSSVGCDIVGVVDQEAAAASLIWGCFAEEEPCVGSGHTPLAPRPLLPTLDHGFITDLIRRAALPVLLRIAPDGPTLSTLGLAISKGEVRWGINLGGLALQGPTLRSSAACFC